MEGKNKNLGGGGLTSMSEDGVIIGKLNAIAYTVKTATKNLHFKKLASTGSYINGI